MARLRPARATTPTPALAVAALGVVAAVCVAIAMLPSAATARKPKLGSTFAVRPISGTVKVKKLGAKSYKRLAARATIKMGSSIDATRGTVKVITARNAKGETQAGTFYDGAFVVTQARAAKAVTELQLLKGDFSKCQAASTSRAWSAATGRPVRKLWGKAHGRFRTKGRFSAATVRGTTWLTEDYCDTSRVESKEGAVTATAAVEQPPGTAPAPAPEYTLQPGQFLDILCHDGAPVTEYFCLLLLSQPADNLFAFGILVRNTTFDRYTLCLTGPYRYDCGDYLFTAPDPNGYRSSAVVCRPGQGPGQYEMAWYLGGYVLGRANLESTQPATDLFCINNP
jgi:hypothetical protein